MCCRSALSALAHLSLGSWRLTASPLARRMGSRKNKRQRRISPVRQELLALQHAYAHAVCARWHLLPLEELAPDVGVVRSLCHAWHMEGVTLAAHALRMAAASRASAAAAAAAAGPHISYGHAHYGEVQAMREGGYMTSATDSESKRRHGRTAEM
jgi:hypothetical protein